MFCIGCDYPLVGLSSQCPECGRAFDPNDPSTFAAESRKARRSQSLFLIPSVISLVFGTLSLVLGLVAFLADLLMPSAGEFLAILLVPLQILGVVAVPICSFIAFAVGAGAMVADRRKVRPILAMIAAFLGPVLIVITWFLQLAILAGCLPWLPNRLSYPELLPAIARGLSPANPPRIPTRFAPRSPGTSSRPSPTTPSTVSTRPSSDVRVEKHTPSTGNGRGQPGPAASPEGLDPPPQVL